MNFGRDTYQRTIVCQHCLTTTYPANDLSDAEVFRLFLPGAIQISKVPRSTSDSEELKSEQKWLILFDSVYSSYFYLSRGRCSLNNNVVDVKQCTDSSEIPEQWLKIQFVDAPHIQYPGMQRPSGSQNPGDFQPLHNNPYGPPGGFQGQPHVPSQGRGHPGPQGYPYPGLTPRFPGPTAGQGQNPYYPAYPMPMYGNQQHGNPYAPQHEKNQQTTEKEKENSSDEDESWSPPGASSSSKNTTEEVPLGKPPAYNQPPPPYQQLATNMPSMPQRMPSMPYGISGMPHGMPYAMSGMPSMPPSMPYQQYPNMPHGMNYDQPPAYEGKSDIKQKGSGAKESQHQAPHDPKQFQPPTSTDPRAFPPNVNTAGFPLRGPTGNQLGQVQNVSEDPLQSLFTGSDMERPSNENVTDDGRDTDEEDEPTAIKVSNLPANVTKEALEDFFENKKRSGGEDVIEIDLDLDTNTAIVTFKEPETVNRVLNKAPLLYNKKQIKVEVFKRDDNDLQDSEEDDEDNDVHDDGCTVEVRGFQGSEETIELYFENKRKSGGGEVIKTELNEDDNICYITFESKEVVERVLSKSKHTVEGEDLEVKLYVPPAPPKPKPTYENRVFIHGFNPESTKDSLENFLEAKADAEVTDIVYGEEEGRAMVTFDTAPDYEKLEKACKKKQLDKHWIRVSKVPISSCVIVTNVKSTTTKDAMVNYFENKKRSGGGDVDNVEYKEEEGAFIVYFEDYKVCEEVCKKKSHTFDGQQMKVQIYHDCIGIPADEEGPRFKIPDPIVFQDLNARKVQFLLKSKPNKDAMDVQAKKTYGKITWPQKHTGPLKVDCTLTKDVKNCKALAKSWKKDVTDAIQKYLDILVVENVQVLQEGWTQVMNELQTLNVQSPEGVAIVPEKKSHEIIIIGHKNVVMDLQNEVRRMIKKVTDDLDMKKQQITEKLQLKHHDILYLSMQHFKEETEQKHPEVKLEFNLKEKEVVLSGLSGVVNIVKLAIYEKLNTICISSAGSFSKPKIDFLMRKEVKTYIASKMKEGNIFAVWSIKDNKTEVMTYAPTDDEAVKAAHLIKEEVIESPIEVPKESVYIINTPEFDDKCKEIKNQYPLSKIDVVKKGTCVMVYTVKDHLANIREIMQDFFTFNTIHQDEMKITPAMMRFLNMRYKKEVEGIPHDLKTEQVQVTHNKDTITIKGTKNGLNQAKQRFDKILQGVVKKRHEIKRPGIAKHIHSEQGKAKISSIERSTKCLIQLEDDKRDSNGQDQDLSRSWSSQKGAKLNDGEIAKYSTHDGVIISVMKGDLTAMDVDVLVNAANSELKHTGGLAKALVKKGGNSIQEECTSLIQGQGHLNEGDVVVTSSGKLKCKKIAHAVGPAWKGGKNQESDDLEECIFESLKQTDQHNFESVAIPALCTGIFGFPIQEATIGIVRSVRKYLKRNPSTGIKKIFLCDVRQETVIGFSQAMKKEFGANVTFLQKIGDFEHTGNRRQSTDANANAAGKPPKLQPLTEVTLGKVIVKIVKGHIANQSADIIVNTASKELNLSQGFVSQSLLKAGGDKLQEECTKNFPDGINFGDIAVTTGGNLKCKHVCHGALPPWDKGQGLSLEVLQTFLKNCMVEASKHKAKTIAFPAMGTGNLGFPKDTVAKEMFSAAADISGHKSSIKEVRFVIYEKDAPTLQAFETELQSRAQQTPGDKKKKNKGPRHGKGFEKTEEEFEMISDQFPQSTDQVCVSLGSMELKIYQGDITTVDVDVIVNSTNEDIDLSRGAVSTAIQKMGGKELEKQIQVQKENMKKEGVAVTTNGGKDSRLPAQFIIHLDASSQGKTWKDRVLQVLTKTENIGKKSVAMPALGTGAGKVSVDNVASNIYDALEKFKKQNPQHVKEVHIVIFQQQMLQNFIAAMQGCFQGAKSKGFFGKAYNYLTGGGSKVDDPKWQPQISKQPQSTSCITIVIFGDSDRDVNRAIKDLEKILDDDFNMKNFEERIIGHLSDKQIAAIYQLQNKHDVEVTVDKSQCMIKLYGTYENLMQASDAVHRVIGEAQKNKQAKMQAELVRDLVQWYFMEATDDKMNMESYPDNVNLLIETAFRDKKPEAKFMDNSGNEYTINFANMEEFPTSSPDDKVRVVRKEKLKDSAFELPANWKEMKDSENLTLVTINQGDQEYSSVISKFHTSVGSQRTIVKLERIQNKMLYQQYVAKKKLMEAQNKPGTQNERELWHGTAPEAVDSINSYGFNRSYCGKNATAYGAGVYFAVNANYSASNTYSRPDHQQNKRMYLCRVLTGEYTKGNSALIVPPSKQDVILYDSVVDNPGGPGMYIIFNDTQAYPDYIITFK